jgi:uncharacterized protein
MDRSSVTPKLDALRGILASLESTLVAFSGGVDSTVVFKVAHEALGARALGITAVSPTFAETEREWTSRLVGEIGAAHRFVETDQLRLPDFVINDAQRCYHCRTDLYGLLKQIQAEGCFSTIVDGTNMDDLSDDRPGLIAAKEHGVRSPLVEAGLTKADVRAIAQYLRLSNWDKPAAPCLSSRIPRGLPITAESLHRVERAEQWLREAGFGQCRVRAHDHMARLELEEVEVAWLADPARRKRLVAALKQFGFKTVTLDLEGYRQGGGN